MQERRQRWRRPRFLIDTNGERGWGSSANGDAGAAESTSEEKQNLENSEAWPRFSSLLSLDSLLLDAV